MPDRSRREREERAQRLWVRVFVILFVSVLVFLIVLLAYSLYHYPQDPYDEEAASALAVQLGSLGLFDDLPVTRA